MAVDIAVRLDKPDMISLISSDYKSLSRPPPHEMEDSSRGITRTSSDGLDNSGKLQKHSNKEYDNARPGSPPNQHGTVPSTTLTVAASVHSSAAGGTGGTGASDTLPSVAKSKFTRSSAGFSAGMDPEKLLSGFQRHQMKKQNSQPTADFPVAKTKDDSHAPTINSDKGRSPDVRQPPRCVSSADGAIGSSVHSGGVGPIKGVLAEYVAKPGVQFYKDLAGKLKQGPVGFTPISELVDNNKVGNVKKHADEDIYEQIVPKVINSQQPRHRVSQPHHPPPAGQSGADPDRRVRTKAQSQFNLSERAVDLQKSAPLLRIRSSEPKLWGRRRDDYPPQRNEQKKSRSRVELWKEEQRRSRSKVDLWREEEQKRSRSRVDLWREEELERSRRDLERSRRDLEISRRDLIEDPIGSCPYCTGHSANCSRVVRDDMKTPRRRCSGYREDSCEHQQCAVSAYRFLERTHSAVDREFSTSNRRVGGASRLEALYSVEELHEPLNISPSTTHAVRGEMELMRTRSDETLYSVHSRTQHRRKRHEHEERKRRRNVGGELVERSPRLYRKPSGGRYKHTHYDERQLGHDWTEVRMTAESRDRLMHHVGVGGVGDRYPVGYTSLPRDRHHRHVPVPDTQRVLQQERELEERLRHEIRNTSSGKKKRRRPLTYHEESENHDFDDPLGGDVHGGNQTPHAGTLHALGSHCNSHRDGLNSHSYVQRSPNYSRRRDDHVGSSQKLKDRKDGVVASHHYSHRGSLANNNYSYEEAVASYNNCSRRSLADYTHGRGDGDDSYPNHSGQLAPDNTPQNIASTTSRGNEEDRMNYSNVDYVDNLSPIYLSPSVLNCSAVIDRCGFNNSTNYSRCPDIVSVHNYQRQALSRGDDINEDMSSLVIVDEHADSLLTSGGGGGSSDLSRFSLPFSQSSPCAEDHPDNDDHSAPMQDRQRAYDPAAGPPLFTSPSESVASPTSLSMSQNALNTTSPPRDSMVDTLAIYLRTSTVPYRRAQRAQSLARCVKGGEFSQKPLQCSDKPVVIRTNSQVTASCEGGKDCLSNPDSGYGSKLYAKERTSSSLQGVAPGAGDRVPQPSGAGADNAVQPDIVVNWYREQELEHDVSATTCPVNTPNESVTVEAVRQTDPPIGGDSLEPPTTDNPPLDDSLRCTERRQTCRPVTKFETTGKQYPLTHHMRRASSAYIDIGRTTAV